MRHMAVAIAVAFNLALGLDAGAGPTVDEAALEREARAISAMLMAPCCYAQQASVHQSDAAEHVRLDVRARLARGEIRADILDAYVARYGTRILAEPPAVGFDLSLYVLPVVTFVLSLALVAIALHRFSRRAQGWGGRTADADDVAGPDPVPASLRRRVDDELRDLD